MIPIGAPVTAENKGNERFKAWKEDGIVISYEKLKQSNCSDMPPLNYINVMLDEDNEDSVFTYLEHLVKIRYDNAAPFTLWQLNAIIHYPANDWFWMGTNIEYGARCLMAVVTRSVN